MSDFLNQIEHAELFEIEAYQRRTLIVRWLVVDWLMDNLPNKYLTQLPLDKMAAILVEDNFKTI